MEKDGSFSLKNLGKSSIFLNGKEVSTGELMGLGSSSLVEVIAFEMDVRGLFQLHSISFVQLFCNVEFYLVIIWIAECAL